MPVLNLRNFSTFFIVVFDVEEGALILKQLVYQYYNMLDCNVKKCFPNHTWLQVWLMERNLLVSSWNFKDRFMLFQIK